MKTRKLELGCPTCGSHDVFYSCTPNCCFNHVCGNCSTTFEPVSETTGDTVEEIEPPDRPPEAGDPTVECGNCESIAVYMTGDNRLVCADCRSVLALELTEIAPGG